jgi:hypothetical protein
MAVQIQFRRGTANEWATVDPVLAVAEMGIETDTDLFKIGNGVDTWTELDYGGLRGFSGSTGYAGSIGNMAVSNVLYVSESGNDSNSGTALNLSKLTIRAALAVATRGTTIFVKSGDYTENNPLTVPDFVSVVGDNLRSVTVRPQNVTQDLFYINNGCYLAHMTFKDHVSPAAAVAFNPDGSAGVISTSPYVQNCTSMTSNGTGMRVDGSHALGTKSMVVDAYTQYNQGGIGIHMLNGGYTQLVSVFTICCDKGFLCESGGNCSITNSNSSFGNYALYASGVSTANYSGKLNGATNGQTFVIDNLTQKPGIGDAVSFGDGDYYTISESTDFKTGNTDIIYPSLTAESATFRNARQTILDERTRLQVETIKHVLEAFPGFDFNQFKCSRDVGDILDAIAYDMVLNTNYRTIKAATSYYRATSTLVVTDQLTQTVSAINFLKVKVFALLINGPADPYSRVVGLFTIFLNIIQNGLGVTPAFLYTPPTGASTATVNASRILQNNKNFIAEETVAYISNFTYNTTSCYRDTGFIVDSLAFDILYGGTSQSTFAGLQYWSQDTYIGNIFSQLTTTTAAIAYARDLAVGYVTSATNVTIASTVTNNFNIIINVLNSGTGGISNSIVPNTFASTNPTILTGYYTLVNNKANIQNNTISWLNSTYPNFSFNTATCYRDLGYIIDGVAFDLLHLGNRQSYMNGVYYYGFNAGNSQVTNEIPQTTAAYNFIKDISAKIVTGTTVTNRYQTLVPQTITTGTAGSAEIRLVNSLITTITDIINTGPSAAPAITPIGLTPNTSTSIYSAYNLLLLNRSFIQAETIAYVNTSFVGLVYSTATCKRDVGYIVDAVTYDVLYGGNSQTADAADSYYDGAVFRIPYNTKPATIAAYYFIKTIIDDCLINNIVSPTQQLVVTQSTTATAATSTQSAIAQALVDIVTNIVENSYSSTITVEEFVPSIINDNTVVTFHQYSLITSSGHSFEWIGAGVNINAALPSLGGEPISANQAVEINGGKVYFTGTDQRGDFRIGNDLTINRNLGTITGRTFTKSLFAVMTPYILAIGS